MKLAALLLIAVARLTAGTIDESLIWGSGPDLFRWVYSVDYGYQPISILTGGIINRIDFGENPILPPEDSAPAALAVSIPLDIPVLHVDEPTAPPQHDTPEPAPLGVALFGLVTILIARRVRGGGK